MSKLKFRATYHMRKYHLTIGFSSKVPLTPRTLGVAEAFGIGIDDDQKFMVVDTDITVDEGNVVYLTGDSGSGKSVILKWFQRTFADHCVDIDTVPIDENKAIVDQVGETLTEALQLLSIVGLNDAYLFLRRYKELSGGQQYRFRIAKLIESKKPVWVLDEFTSTLDRDTAKIVAWNMQKLARQYGRTLLVATCMNDLGDDLMPDVRVDKRYNEEIAVSYNTLQDPKFKCSLEKDMVVEVGDKHDWEKLMVFHYRSHKIMIPRLYVRMVRRIKCTHENELSPDLELTSCDICELPKGAIPGKDKLCYKNELVGIVVFSSPPMNVYGRAQVFGGKCAMGTEGLKWLNANMRQISRVVIHPKYRSMGLGVRLIREALALAQTEWTETIAVMAKYNPFFEKAGMLKVAERPIDKGTKKLIDYAQSVGLDKTLLTSETYVKGVWSQLGDVAKLNLRQILAQNVKGPGFGDYLKQRNFDSRAKDFNVNFVNTATDDFVCKLIARNAIMASPKIYLVYSKQWATNECLKYELKERLENGCKA
jgi:ABC-type lipoprotein export system ATPase subunit/ribosomal protein S18 acetylase RimI-like enzyme